MNELIQLSCVRPLSIVTRNAVFIKAIPSETMKWKCHFVGNCANCVAEKGAHTAPKPDDENSQYRTYKIETLEANRIKHA